jgi:type II secretory pathway component GspD/PulD (secretin)
VHPTRYAVLLTLIVFAVCPIQARGAQSQLAPLQPVPVTQLDVRQPHPELDGPRVSLALPNATPIKDILLRLVRGTRLSVIPDPSLDQKFLGDLKNVTIREALDLILEPIGLEYSVRGQVIRVFPRELETRFYSVDYVVTTRSSSDAPSLYVDLAAGVKALLSPDGRMNLDRTAALLQVTDRSSRLTRVEQYLENVMLRVTRQVQIEAKVIEVELRDESSTGVNWPAVTGNLANNGTTPQPPAGATAGGSTRTLNAGDTAALLNALAAQGNVTVLSTARITAMNNEPAIVRVGTQTDGVKLSVTPQISADGMVHMKINPSITERTGVTREADTLVRVRQGETIVVAGLMQDRGVDETSRRKTDLVILLTPTLMGPGGTLATTAREIQRLEDARATAGAR